MLKKVLLIAGTLGFSGAALANPPHWAPAYGYRVHQHYRPYVVAPRPVYVAPRPVYVVPAPRVVYAAPPPAVIYPAPVYPAPGVSIRFNLPL
jgi:hypothetical protein